MSQRTYICLPCRSTRRAEAAGGLKTPLRCASCAGPLWELSPETCVPRKSDSKAWKKLAAAVSRCAPARQSLLRRRGLALLRKIDQETQAFSARDPSAQREAILKDLKHEREMLLQKYAAGGVHLEPAGEV
ncbi:hypothetical protein [Prosthecobacter sp.]|uniref:hypothetical protein n=1 Tax=Prosthecobacter sp. TaxID=1965333 RepID=UPI0037840562